MNHVILTLIEQKSIQEVQINIPSLLKIPDKVYISFGTLVHQGHTKIIIIIKICIAVIILNNQTIASNMMMMMTKTRRIYLYVYPPHTMMMRMMMMMMMIIMMMIQMVLMTFGKQGFLWSAYTGPKCALNWKIWQLICKKWIIWTVFKQKLKWKTEMLLAPQISQWLYLLIFIHFHNNSYVIL